MRVAPQLQKYWYVIAQQPAPAPHLARLEGCAALRMMLVTVLRVSRSCEHFPDGLDLHLVRHTLRIYVKSIRKFFGTPACSWLRCAQKRVRMISPIDLVAPLRVSVGMKCVPCDPAATQWASIIFSTRNLVELSLNLTSLNRVIVEKHHTIDNPMVEAHCRVSALKNIVKTL